MCLTPHTSEYFSHFSLPMQAVFDPPANRPVLGSPDAFSSGYVSLHTCTILFVCLCGMLPSLVPCCLPSHFFFPAPPPHGPLFRVSGFTQSSFWVDCPPSEQQGIPLSSPPHTSPQSHALIAVLFHVLPSLHDTFFSFYPPFFHCPL
jgi:hypothetical protein